MKTRPQLNLLSVSTVESAILDIIQTFETLHGIEVNIEFNTTPKIKEKNLLLENIDIVISTQELIEQLTQQNILLKGSTKVLGKTEVVMAKGQNCLAPKISSVSEFIDLMMRSNEIIYTTASSGIYIDELFQILQIKNSIESKCKRFSTGRNLLDYLCLCSKTTAPDHWIIGLGANTEILQYASAGIELLSPLPLDIRHLTTYSMAALIHSEHLVVAQQFIHYVHLPQSMELLRKFGLNQNT